MKRALGAILLCGLAACSSIHDLAGGTPEGPHVYGGVRTFPAILESGGMKTRGCAGLANLPLILCFGLIDLPLSLVMDTLLLPITVPVSVFRSEEAP